MQRSISFNEASRTHQNRIKKQIRQRLLTIQNEVLVPHGLQFRCVQIDSNEIEIVERIEDFKCELILNPIEEISIRKVIFIKDKNNISDATYSSLRKDLKLKLPSLNELKNKIRSYDQMLNILQNTKGVYLNIQEKLKLLIPKIKNNFINKDSSILNIKFSADGAQIIKNKSILNLTFTILNEGKKAETASGNYTCGLFDISNEDYETINVCLEQIKTEINDLKELEIDGLKYKIETYIGGDLKMLAIIYGINQANANCPCIWCVWDKRKLVNKDIQKVIEQLETEWSIIDREKGARTLEESFQSIGKKGYVSLPIMNIPFHRIVVDTLHLFLRITDVLYDLFIKDLRQIDGKQKNETDFTTQPHLRQFFSDLFEIYKIRRPYYVDGNKIKIRDLQGPEKKKLFNEVDLKLFAPNNEKIIKTDKLWKDFMSIFNDIKSNQLNTEDTKKKTKDWLLDFAKLYDVAHITPYMHCFSNHLHEFVEMYGGINQLNLEGLEKLNDFFLFRATNMHADYLAQILRKRNRIEVICRE